MDHQRYAHLRGDERAATREKAKELYLAGCTIRSVAGQISRSYGATRALLMEANVRLRAAGGNTRKAAL